MIDDDDSEFSLPNQDSLLNALIEDTPKKIQPKKMPPINLQNQQTPMNKKPNIGLISANTTASDTAGKK